MLATLVATALAQSAEPTEAAETVEPEAQAWPSPSDDSEDDPAAACTLRQQHVETGRWLGKEIVAGATEARRGNKVVAVRIDEATVRSADGAWTGSWLQNDDGDYLVMVGPDTLARSYRFWDDAIVGIEAADGSGARFIYDILGCDAQELLLGVVGGWSARR